MKKQVLVFMLVLTACGQENAPSLTGYYRQVDSELEEYVQLFEKEWGKEIDFQVKISTIPVENEESKKAGVCYVWTTGKKIAVIDTEFFATRTKNQIEQVVMHELGHCALNKKHDDTTWNFERYRFPNSVMRSYAFNRSEAEQYAVHYHRYMDELFDRE
jgi:predicted SprT family Zn-dependent metalloprotease